MTLPFLIKDLRTVNQIPNLWGTSTQFDAIELAITNGDRLRYGIDQIDNIFFVKLPSNTHMVCLVIVLTYDSEPKRFIICNQMAADLVNHVNKRRFTNALSYDEQSDFFRGCQ